MGQKKNKGKNGDPVAETQDFIEHFGAYVIVISFLAILNIFSSPGDLWFQWIALFWGIGIAFHALDVFSNGGSLALWMQSRRSDGDDPPQEAGPLSSTGSSPRQEYTTMATSEEYERLAREHVNARDGLIKHSGAFLAVGLFFLIINLVTDANSLWFFWPMLPWAVGLGIHAWVTYWDQRKFYDRWEERAVEQIRQRTAPRMNDSTDKGTNAPEIEQIMDRAADLIDQMRKSARRIPDPVVRSQALEACASSDQVLSAIGDHQDELPIARDFVNRFLQPANSIINDYARLAKRNVPSARETLRQVEEHDLPLLNRKADELYDRLHRGTLIDLEVAREMLTLDMPASMDKALPPEE